MAQACSVVPNVWDSTSRQGSAFDLAVSFGFVSLLFPSAGLSKGLGSAISANGCCCSHAVRTVPGATDEMSAVTKAPRHNKPAFDFAKAMSEMPEVHDYEYIMPPTAAKDKEQLSAAELKVGEEAIRGSCVS